MAKKKGLSSNNKKLIEEFIQDLKLGKPILNQKKKPIAEKTARKYTNWLKKISVWLGNKDFDKVTQEDIDKLRSSLKNDKIRSISGKPYNNSTKRDIEYKIIRMLFKWLGKERLVYYVDQYHENTEIPALRKEEVERMVNASKLRDKLIIQLLFDGGFRASEFLNIKYSDIKEDARKDGYYKIRITKSKTKPRTISLLIPATTKILDEWLETNKKEKGTGQPLVSLNYDSLNKLLKRRGKEVLNKKVYPHLLRHTSCTYYCHQLNNYQMCKRYGWSMASNMPMIYIDREGVDDEVVNKKIISDETGKLREEYEKVCAELNLLKSNNKEMDEKVSKILKAMQQYKKIKELKLR